MAHEQHQQDRARFQAQREPMREVERFRAQFARILSRGGIPAITQEQQLALWALAQERGLDPAALDWWCRVLAGVLVEQLSRDQAEAVIAALHETRREA